MYNKMKYHSSSMCFYVYVLQFLNLLCEWNSLNECNVLKELVSFETQISIYFFIRCKVYSLYLEGWFTTAQHCLKRRVELYHLSMALSTLPCVFHDLNSIFHKYKWSSYLYRRCQVDLEGGIMTASHCLKRCVEVYPLSSTTYPKFSSAYHLNYEPHRYNSYIMQCRKLGMSHPLPTNTENVTFIFVKLK